MDQAVGKINNNKINEASDEDDEWGDLGTKSKTSINTMSERRSTMN
jgi:hypothetical protein